MNKDYSFQFISPIILFLILYYCNNSEMYLLGSIIVIAIVFLNILNGGILRNINRLSLEIIRFINYYIMLAYSFRIVFLLLDDKNRLFMIAMFVLLLIFSMHIRLIKFDTHKNELSYNLEINRIQYYSSRNTVKYPKISNFTLFRFEFYIVLGFINLLITKYGFFRITDIKYSDMFEVFVITILSEVVIYLLLSKFTNLLK